MKKLKFQRALLALTIVSGFLYSCSEDETVDVIINNSVKKAFITNEGNWGSKNGSISIFESDSNRVTNYIFESANPGMYAGDVIMNLGLTKSKAYIVSNTNEVVKVVNLSNFKQIAEAKVAYPRYFLLIDSFSAYISSGKLKGSLKLLNLSTNTFTDSIVVGNGPEQMVKVDNTIYVANSGGWLTDSTVMVVDIQTKKITKSITVGEAPLRVVTDANNDVWVLCIGNWAADFSSRKKSQLVKINHVTKTVEKTFIISEKTNGFRSNPLAISADKKTIYYNGTTDVYAFSITGTELPKAPFLTTSELNGISVDPENGDIYCFSGDYTSAGKMKIFDKSGVFKAEYTVGIAPNGAVFNY
jgi:YVTN family beta-propeller protein